jgi:peptide/nickel transport system substrate-binding protein
MHSGTHRTLAGRLLVGILASASTLALAYQQAPTLDKLVSGKQLPPVAQRLPDKPQVVKPVTRVGTYGGMLRTAMRSNSDHNSILRMIGNQGLTRWSMDFNSIVPNVAESWAANSNASEYVFKLRRGMKWSDGTPFTADDVVFSMNDLVNNKEFFATTPSTYVVRDKPVETIKVDENTVKFKFAGSYIGFPEALALPINQHPVMYQKKYCSQFHPKYNPDIAKLIAAANAKNWPTLMRIKCGDIEMPTRWGNPDRPTLDPWVIKDPYNGSGNSVVLSRNPYFWQVDTAGNQLPYIDTVRFSVISEAETIMLAVINGQLDFQHRHIYSIQNRPVLAENAEKGGYTLMGLSNLAANTVAIYFNMSTKNAKLRELIRKKDFREALSIATDRKEINDIVFLGQGAPWQVGPLPQSRWYNEKLGRQYTDYKPAEANALLDKLGLTKRDAQGYRLYPDGTRVSLGVIVSIGLEQQVDALQLVAKQWSRVGIELSVQSSERSLFYDRANSNNYDLSADMVGGGLDITMNPRAIVAIHPTESRQSLLWAKWYLSNGKQGEEPSASMKKRYALYEKWQGASSAAEADAAFKEIIQIAADEFEVMGLVRPPKDPAIHSKKLQNVFEQMPAGWSYATPGPSLPQQWYFIR